MKWGNRTFVRAGPMSAEQLRQAFAVPEDHTLLVGVLHVLQGVEEEAARMVEDPEVVGEKNANWRGAMRCARDSQAAIMDLVRESKKAK